MSKGTIVLVPFPFTDLSGRKVRPALVLHSSKKGEDCIVVFISSAVQKKINMFDIEIKASSYNGLKQNSVIKTDKIATLQKKTILGEIGNLEAKIILEVNKKLKLLFDL